MSVTEGTNVLEQELEKINIDINNVSRRKLITIVGGGLSDSVMYIEPLDLRGKDPDELVEIIERQVEDSDYSQGYAVHKVRNVRTGKFQPRWKTEPQKFTGPFGSTYKINTSHQDGEREYEELKRVLHTHISRMTKVPEFVPYHADITEMGSRDLKSLSIAKEDVPVAMLENYKPLEDLKNKRDNILRQLGMNVEVPTKEEMIVKVAQDSVHRCTHPGCDFIGKSEQSIRCHISKAHSKG